MKYDVIHDTLIVIRTKNLKRSRNFGDMGTGRNIAKYREIAYVFLAMLGRRYGASSCIPLIIQSLIYS